MVYNRVPYCSTYFNRREHDVVSYIIIFFSNSPDVCSRIIRYSIYIYIYTIFKHQYAQVVVRSLFIYTVWRLAVAYWKGLTINSKPFYLFELKNKNKPACNDPNVFRSYRSRNEKTYVIILLFLLWGLTAC